jgi:hypothetical protein
MSTHRVVFFAVASLTLVVVACAHEIDRGPAIATTTGAIITNPAAVLQIAKARCRRLAECNDLANGHLFADEAQCVRAYQDEDADLRVVRGCPYGVDKGHLDSCVAQLVDEECRAHFGPVTRMLGCSSYCARAE